MRRIARLGCALFFIIMASCGGHQVKLIDGPAVDDVELRGVQRFSKDTLLSYLHGGENSWVPLTAEYAYDAAVMAADARRIEALYRAFGYRQARVVDWQVQTEDDEARLVITVEEGPLTRVIQLEYEWLGVNTPALRAVTTAEVSLSVGGPFEVGRLNDSIGALQLALQLRGYPFAKVEGGATLDGESAVVRFTVVPGPRTTIGPIDFVGLEDIPEDQCRREVRFAQGQPYSRALTEQMEKTLGGMDVFRWVSVRPAALSADDEVRLQVRVAEEDPQALRLGVGVGFEATRWEEWLSARYTHTNLFGELTRLDLEAQLGWAQLPNPLDPQADGPVVKLRPRFTKKGLVEDHLVWSLTPAFETNVRKGYKYWSPSNRVGVARWFAGFIRADLSHNLTHVDFYDLDVELDRNTTQLGRDFRDPYTLSYLEAQLDLHFVDDLLDPRNGAVLSLVHDVAGGLFLGDYDHHKTTVTGRAYWRIHRRLQLAARAETGMIWVYGTDPGVPFDRRFYLGGANSVRGWGTDRLAPRLDCSNDPSPNTCEAIPVGGSTMVLGNLELRWNFAGAFALAAFADAGDVQADEFTWDATAWNYTAGPGLRFDSPIGLFRLDAGFRLNEDPRYPDEAPWAIHFGLGESF